MYFEKKRRIGRRRKQPPENSENFTNRVISFSAGPSATVPRYLCELQVLWNQFLGALSFGSVPQFNSLPQNGFSWTQPPPPSFNEASTPSVSFVFSSLTFSHAAQSHKNVDDIITISCKEMFHPHDDSCNHFFLNLFFKVINVCILSPSPTPSPSPPLLFSIYILPLYICLNIFIHLSLALSSTFFFTPFLTHIHHTHTISHCLTVSVTQSHYSFPSISLLIQFQVFKQSVKLYAGYYSFTSIIMGRQLKNPEAFKKLFISVIRSGAFLGAPPSYLHHWHSSQALETVIYGRLACGARNLLGYQSRSAIFLAGIKFPLFIFFSSSFSLHLLTFYLNLSRCYISLLCLSLVPFSHPPPSPLPIHVYIFLSFSSIYLCLSLPSLFPLFFSLPLSLSLLLCLS